MAKKCQLCDEPAVQPFDGKWYCWKHYCEVKRKSNKKNYIIQLIKKPILFGGIVIGIVVGIIITI